MERTGGECEEAGQISIRSIQRPGYGLDGCRKEETRDAELGWIRGGGGYKVDKNQGI